MNEQTTPRDIGYVPYSLFIELHNKQDERHQGEINTVRGQIEQVQSQLRGYATKDDLANQTQILRMEIGTVKTGVDGVSSNVSGVQSQLSEVKNSLMDAIHAMKDDITCMTKEQTEKKMQDIAAQGDQKLENYKRIALLQSLPITVIGTIAVYIIQHFLSH